MTLESKSQIHKNTYIHCNKKKSMMNYRFKACDWSAFPDPVFWLVVDLKIAELCLKFDCGNFYLFLTFFFFSKFHLRSSDNSRNKAYWKYQLQMSIIYTNPLCLDNGIYYQKILTLSIREVREAIQKKRALRPKSTNFGIIFACLQQ